MESHDKGQYEQRFLRPDGSTGYYQSSFEGVYDELGELTAIRGTVLDITGRILAEAALIESEQRFREVVERSPEAIFIQTNRCFQYLNPKALKLFGASTENELLGTPIIDHFHPDDHQAIRERIRLLNDDRIGQTQQEERLLQLDGSVVWVEVSAVPFIFHGENGALVFAYDLTERKHAEAAIRESEERYRGLFEQMRSGVAVYQPVEDGSDFILQDLNPAAGRISNLITADVLGKHLSEIYAGVPHAQQIVKDVWRTQQPIYLPEIYFSTRHVAGWRELFVYPLASGEVVVVYDDITERREAADYLRRIEWLLKSTPADPGMFLPSYGEIGNPEGEHAILDAVGKPMLLDTVNGFALLLGGSAAIYEKNGDHAVCVFGSEWCRNLDESSFRATGCEDPLKAIESGNWLCRERCQRDLVRPTLESGAETEHICPSGLTLYAVPISARGQVIGAIHVAYDEPPRTLNDLERVADDYKLPIEQVVEWAGRFESRPRFIVDVAKDRLRNTALLIGLIVEQHWAQQEIQELNTGLEQRVADRTRQLQDANRELESFSYSVSHDLRAPLRAISGFSDILIEDHATDMNSEGMRVLGIIRNNIQRMGLLIDDLLAFSRISRQEMKSLPIDMTALAKEVFSEVNDRPGQIEFLLDELPSATGDPVLVRQVWVNLLANSVKFTSQNPRACIEVHARILEQGCEYVVGDNGVGFDQKYVDKLFGTFQRLHNEKEFPGTGIGLALVKRIVQRHLGSVWAKGQPEKGAEFGFILPCGKGAES
jgi:PAS domain S-box-containing protein